MKGWIHESQFQDEQKLSSYRKSNSTELKNLLQI